jgi:hypothetical protein
VLERFAFQCSAGECGPSTRRLDGARESTAPAVSPAPLRFARRETALRSNPAAGASRKGRFEVRLFAQKGLGISHPHGSRLHERDANVSLRAVSGCAVRRHAQTSGRERHRRRRGSGRSVSGEPPSRCGRSGSPTPGRRFSIAAITVPAIREAGMTRGRNNAW